MRVLLLATRVPVTSGKDTASLSAHQFYRADIQDKLPVCENSRGMPNSSTARDIALIHVRMTIRAGKNATKARRRWKFSRRMESTDSATKVSIVYVLYSTFQAHSIRPPFLYMFQTSKADCDEKDVKRVKARCFSTPSLKPARR